MSALSAFVDFEGAFDGVSFESNTRALAEHDVSETLSRWILSIIQNRNINIPTSSSVFRARITKESGVISPLLLDSKQLYTLVNQ